MKMIIAPAKQMAVDLDNFAPETQPQFQSQAQQLLEVLRQLTYPEAQQLWHCSDKLAQRNFDWLHQMDLTRQVTPALLSYHGLQYQHMAPDLFTAPALDYVRHNLRILSGFYGLLRPFDGIVPYRLEMQARLSVGEATNLYAFWGDRLYHALAAPTEPIINLASQEYAKAITPYLQPNQPFITVVFASLVNGKLKTKATLAKMARGAMVRYLAENQVTTIDAVKDFDHPDYRFDASHSTSERLVFVYQK